MSTHVSSVSESQSTQNCAPLPGSLGTSIQERAQDTCNELFDPRILQWTPSYVSGSSCTNSSKHSSRRSSSNRSSTEGIRYSPDHLDPHAPILEEEEGEEDKRFQRFKLKQEELAITHSPEAWTEWRADFPLEVLNAFADFFEGFPTVELQRSIPLASVAQLISKVLSFPAGAVVAEAAEAGFCGQAGDMAAAAREDAKVQFSGLTHFLAFVRNIVERVEREHVEQLWSAEDLVHVKAVFRRHASAGRAAVTDLFAIVNELGFDDLDCRTVDQQRWLSGVTRQALEKRSVGSIPKGSPGPGSIVLQDLVRIVTLALRSKERARRQAEYVQELEVQKECGYSPLELEDLRELHSSYLSDPGGPLQRLATLFLGLGVELAPEEMALLRTIVKKHTPEEHLRSGDGQTPFNVFVHWLRAIFAERIGGIEWHGESERAPPEERRGFCPAMIREWYAAIADAIGSSSSGSRSNSLRHNTLGSMGSSVPSSASHRTSSASGRAWLVSQGSRLGSRVPSRGSRAGGSRRESSRSTSRRESHRSRSCSNTPPVDRSTRAEFDHSVDDESALVLNKGLPSSDAMLGRRLIRAPSVDLSTSSQLDRSRPEDGSRSSNLPSLPSLPGSRQLGQTTQKTTQRKVREAKDANLVVSEAIQKLASIAREDLSPLSCTRSGPANDDFEART